MRGLRTSCVDSTPEPRPPENSTTRSAASPGCRRSPTGTGHYVTALRAFGREWCGQQNRTTINAKAKSRRRTLAADRDGEVAGVVRQRVVVDGEEQDTVCWHRDRRLVADSEGRP